MHGPATSVRRAGLLDAYTAAKLMQLLSCADRTFAWPAAAQKGFLLFLGSLCTPQKDANRAFALILKHSSLPEMEASRPQVAAWVQDMGAFHQERSRRGEVGP